MPASIVSVFGIIYVISNTQALVSTDKYKLADTGPEFRVTKEKNK